MYPAGTEIDGTRAKYPPSQDAIIQAGFVDVGHDEKCSLIWIDGILTMDEAEKIRMHQRVNKIPCMDFICFKSTLFDELNRVRAKYPNLVDFYPPTYLLPSDYPEFQSCHSKLCAKKPDPPMWVVKPPSGSCGRGIHLISSLYEALNIPFASVAQLMVEPLMLDGYKFDFRFFLLISSLSPYSAFIYKEGIARFCTERYTHPTKKTRDHRFMNLTNTAVNVGSERPPEEFTQPATAILEQVARRSPGMRAVWGDISDACRMLLASIYPTILATLPKHSPGAIAPEQMEPSQHFFHLLGVDIIIDSNGKPRVLELNDRPSYSVTVPFEKDLKTNMLREIFYHVTSDGSTLGPNENSGWQQILPVEEDSKLRGPIQSVMSVISNRNYLGRAPSQSPVTTRMLESGIDGERHEESRKRANFLRETSKAPRFKHHLKAGPL
jgi:hypothetical protein